MLISIRNARKPVLLLLVMTAILFFIFALILKHVFLILAAMQKKKITIDHLSLEMINNMETQLHHTYQKFVTVKTLKIRATCRNFESCGVVFLSRQKQVIRPSYIEENRLTRNYFG